ncbi:MAG TPA: aminotransferase class I/II-fold pyridoxal phosphate-dependent enzyme [Candidatus Merdenecus merdavium]|nr:aminotransferase class I/II-fold pyridoxal phosphate-dependent enzyme [Candidatus Merdenecus merdavium]
MKITFADRMQKGESSIFTILNEKKDRMMSEGKEIFDMSIGTPDFPPAPHVITALAEAGMKAENYKYAVVDLPELQDAVIGHYKNRFEVELTRDEVMSVNGSQEGIAHIAFSLCNPGDLVLIPDPGYPIFCDGPQLAGAITETYPLYEKNGFLPDLKQIPEDVAKKAKVMIVSFPMNPVGVVAPDEFYMELIAFAKKYEIIIIHDNAYSDIIFGGKKGKSFLSFDGAKEVGVEFYSLSKSYNLTGARISFAIGNHKIIQMFKKLRSKIDYGVFLPIQYAAIAALEGDQSLVKEQCKKYESRGKKLCHGLRELGWMVPDVQGTMFVWAPIPKTFKHSVEFCNQLLEETGVICTPGICFGKLGEGYVRFALVLNEDRIDQALEAIRISNIIK